MANRHILGNPHEFNFLLSVIIKIHGFVNGGLWARFYYIIFHVIRCKWAFIYMPD